MNVLMNVITPITAEQNGAPYLWGNQCENQPTIQLQSRGRMHGRKKILTGFAPKPKTC